MAKDVKVPTKDKRFAPQKLETVKQPVNPTAHAQDFKPKKEKK